MTTAEKEALVRECRASGQSARAWSQAHGIPYTTYTNWSKRVPRESEEVETPSEPAQQWAAIPAGCGEEPSPAKGSPIRLTCGSWTVNVERGFDAEALTGVLRAVRASCC
ncbi:MAG: hypothetical protein FWC62_09835 [Firmicutes bacterium]|nr:hypothetical protein [Bacillota bacterium]